jgi:hypothetical protein
MPSFGIAAPAGRIAKSDASIGRPGACSRHEADHQEVRSDRREVVPAKLLQ